MFETSLTRQTSKRMRQTSNKCETSKKRKTSVIYFEVLKV